MSLHELSKQNPIAGGSQRLSQRGQVVIQPIVPSEAMFISPIERWPDNNYKPYELDYLYNHKIEAVEIVAPLHGFEAQNVYVDIAHGQMIILLSDSDLPGAIQQEYYCEIPLPANISHEGAYIEIGGHFLTIHLSQKRSLFKRAAAAAYIFKNGFALFFGCQWNFGRLDD